MIQMGRAQSFTVLYSFTGGTDGRSPEAGVILDSAGNLYGTTYKGGASARGMIFKVNPTGGLIILHSFTGGSDGAFPYAPLIVDSVGNLYGTAAGEPRKCGAVIGCGVAFKLSPAGDETVIHRFTGPNGANPYFGLTHWAGKLYSTTMNGGGGSQGTCNLYFKGCGVVFMMDSAGSETVLYAFTGGVDGGPPSSGIVQDAGNLYGTTYNGGAYNRGTVYKVDTMGTETVLYSFSGGTDGGTPVGGVILDAAGNLYGTAYTGGIATCQPSGCGLVFKLNPNGTETVLYSFTGGANGSSPQSGVIMDPAGNLYGTTYFGGIGTASGNGVVFKLSPDGKETTLHRFAGADGRYPHGLVLDSAGDLYGTTTEGGSGYGTVFKLKP
jgi:uncharacterized repeat protein (TIGR03803 family)